MHICIYFDICITAIPLPLVCKSSGVLDRDDVGVHNNGAEPVVTLLSLLHLMSPLLLLGSLGGGTLAVDCDPDTTKRLLSVLSIITGTKETNKQNTIPN